MSTPPDTGVIHDDRSSDDDVDRTIVLAEHLSKPEQTCGRPPTSGPTHSDGTQPPTGSPQRVYEMLPQYGSPRSSGLPPPSDQRQEHSLSRTDGLPLPTSTLPPFCPPHQYVPLPHDVRESAPSGPWPPQSAQPSTDSSRRVCGTSTQMQPQFGSPRSTRLPPPSDQRQEHSLLRTDGLPLLMSTLPPNRPPHQHVPIPHDVRESAPSGPCPPQSVYPSTDSSRRVYGTATQMQPQPGSPRSTELPPPSDQRQEHSLLRTDGLPLPMSTLPPNRSLHLHVPLPHDVRESAPSCTWSQQITQPPTDSSRRMYGMLPQYGWPQSTELPPQSDQQQAHNQLRPDGLPLTSSVLPPSCPLYRNVPLPQHTSGGQHSHAVQIQTEPPRRAYAMQPQHWPRSTELTPLSAQQEEHMMKPGGQPKLPPSYPTHRHAPQPYPVSVSMPTNPQPQQTTLPSIGSPRRVYEMRSLLPTSDQRQDRDLLRTDVPPLQRSTPPPSGPPHQYYRLSPSGTLHPTMIHLLAGPHPSHTMPPSSGTHWQTGSMPSAGAQQQREVTLTSDVSQPAGESRPNDRQHQSGALDPHSTPITRLHNISTVTDQLSSVMDLNRRIQELQRESNLFREVNATLQAANDTYERERHLFQRAIERGSLGSGASSHSTSDFAGFEPLPSQRRDVPDPARSESEQRTNNAINLDPSEVTVQAHATPTSVTAQTASKCITFAPTTTLFETAAQHQIAYAAPTTTHMPTTPAPTAIVQVPEAPIMTAVETTAQQQMTASSWEYVAPMPYSTNSQHVVRSHAQQYDAGSSNPHYDPGNPAPLYRAIAPASQYSMDAPALRYSTPAPATLVRSAAPAPAAPMLAEVKTASTVVPVTAVNYPATSAPPSTHALPSYVPRVHPNDTIETEHQPDICVRPNISASLPIPQSAPVPSTATTQVQPVAAYYVNTYNVAGGYIGASNGNNAYMNRANTAYVPLQSAPSARGAAYQTDAATTIAPPIRADQPSLADIRAMPYRRMHDLPQFSGRPEEWPLFICSYETTTSQFGYTDIENMMRLQKSLVGVAKARVQSILIRPEHVGRAVEALARAFGRPETLVESQLNEARKLPKIYENRLDQMISFSISVDGLVSFLDGAATQHHLENPTLLNELEVKLPMSERLKWAAVARQIQPYPSIRDFARWLSDTAELISTITTYASCVSPPHRVRESKPSQTKGKHVLLNVTSRATDRDAEKCAVCGEAHTIRQCEFFRKLNVKERLLEVRKRPLCYGCLGEGHLLPSCDKKKACELDGCERYHHQLLHQSMSIDRRPTQPRAATVVEPTSSSQRASAVQQSQGRPTAPAPADQRQPSVPEQEPTTAEPSTVLNCQGGRPRQTLYYRIVPVALHGPSRRIQTYALLDEGSSVSLIDADLAEELQLDGEMQTLNLQFVSGSSSAQPSRDVHLGISGIEPDAVRFDIDSVQTAKELSLPVQTVNRHAVVAENPHLAGIPFATFENIRPKLLLGLEHHYLGVPLETRSSACLRSVVAARTKLGWVLYGSNKRSTLPTAVVLHAREPDEDADVNTNHLELLHELVKQHFTTEQFGVREPSEPIQSDADKRACSILEKTTRRIGDRFETGLLWKQDNIVLPDSYSMALHRLTSVEAKMRRNPEYAQQYRTQIQAYLDKGYARKMTRSEIIKESPRTWYLPHFAVQNASKPGKFRLVFDAAATAHNVSLNSMLLAGPDLNVPLTRLLFRFRLGVVGVCADVREMFHQVMVRKSDQDAQRFLWRDGDGSAAPSVYVMNVMTFGSTCSPTSAQFVKNANAQQFANQFPEAADAVQRNHYVDDYVASFRTTEDAQRITAEVIDLHKRGGFELRGVVSNSSVVRTRFGATNDSNQSVCMEPEDLTQKILGMTWETMDDTFGFQTRFHRVNPDVMDGTRRPTKREVLSVAMSIFDPFGLLANFLLPSKTILQELWRIGVKWDEPVPEQINTRWQEWRAQVEHTRRVKIPRCYSSSILTAPGLQLHVFADASEEAFAAVAYWRIDGAEGIELAFVAGKVRCAPVKILSVPRLELQAAVLATRLMLEIRRSHDELRIAKIVFWSDSETVLKWLRCDQRRYVQFVAFRVAEVVENAPADWWRWVPTALNVADDATRVKTPIVFDPDSRWLRGPSWLCGDETTWPTQPSYAYPADSEMEELRPRFIGAVSRRGAVDFTYFSTFNRMVRSFAWARRFMTNARVVLDAREKGELTSIEMSQSTDMICRIVQKEMYADEVAALSSGQLICQSSKLFTLKPYLDDTGVLRLHGRTDAAEFLSNSAKRPIIMPREHYVTVLIVMHHHELFAHQLTDATIASVREKYWVPQLRMLVKSVRHACQTCRVRSAAPMPPMQGQLPPDRLNAYARPFTNTGLDFFGPVQVTVGRRREKRWVALFTCLAVRAVHLEVAADLSTDACLICLRNLCHLRGVPAMIRCDNGTNFVGARNELSRETTFFDPDEIQRELSVKGVDWKFNCPGNPEAGGAWERLVQSVKRVLDVTLREEAPRVETFRALLLEAANIINSRPLTHLQVDPEEQEPLTPNHFLLGGPNVATVPNPSDVEPTATRRQWKICRGLSRRFWSQFVRDYLPELTRRSRHYPEEPPLCIGDVVIICDENQPRGRWTRGRITEVVQARDGAVRTATVQTAHGSFRRPATKLARLNLSPSGDVDVRGAVSRTCVAGAI